MSVYPLLNIIVLVCVPIAIVSCMAVLLVDGYEITYLMKRAMATQIEPLALEMILITLGFSLESP